GGRAVACLRVSGADPRPRHRGISHHSLTAYGRVLSRPADLVVPDLAREPAIDPALAEQVAQEAGSLVAGAPHLSLCTVATEGLRQSLADTPVPLSTMGRGLEQDPAAFLAAGAAGRHAAALLAPPPPDISG